MAKGRAIVPQASKSGASKTATRRTAAAGRGSSGARRRTLPWLVGGLVALAVIVGLALMVQANSASVNAPGQRIPVQAADHINVGAAHAAYNSDPPTSGPHYAEPIPAGFYEAPQADEAVVHNLEHGHIWIAYDCSKLTDCEGTKQQLRQLVSSYNQFKIVVTPRQNKDAAIAVAAWGWLEKLNSYDEAQIRRFVAVWRDKGPEKTAE